MKKIIKIGIIIILLISALFINKEVKALLPLSGKIIIIDPGHGWYSYAKTSEKAC